jgi:hypothetical protein
MTMSDEPQELSYQQLLDVASEFTEGFGSVMFWASQPRFVAAANRAYAMGQECDPGEGWVHVDDDAETVDVDEVRSQGYEAARTDARERAGDTEKLLTWLREGAVP